jgi:hypothetical protein
MLGQVVHAIPHTILFKVELIFHLLRVMVVQLDAQNFGLVLLVIVE